MSTARPTLAAEHRDITGKAVSRLRRAGRLPAVVYGHGVDSSNLSVDTHDFELLRRRTGPNALVDLSVDGKKAQPVLIQSVQVHPVDRRIVHVDLFLVRMTEEMTVDVPLVPVGTSEAVDTAGGTLLHMTDTVKVRALPDRLPSSIEYPIEGLVDFDAAIYVRELTIPDDVTLLTDGDEIVAKVQAPRVEEVAVPAETETEEGAEAAAESGAESDAGSSSDSGSDEG